MARSKRTRKFSGSQSADAFILPKGRSVIKGFDVDDGDFIGVGSDATFKLLQRKGGVLVKGKGFRSMVKGITVAVVEKVLEKETPLPDWDQYVSEGVKVSEINGWLTFKGAGVVEAPESAYKGWKNIQVGGDYNNDESVSFPGKGMILDRNNTTVNILQDGNIGDIKIDGGAGKDTVIVSSFWDSAPISRDGSIEPKNIEVFRLATHGGGDINAEPNGFEILGSFPNMSVEIAASRGGGIAIDESTRLKNIKVVFNESLRGYGTKHPFVRVLDDDIIDFKKAFSDKDQKLVLDLNTGFDEKETEDWSYNITLKGPTLLLEGDFVNAKWEDIIFKDVDHKLDRYAFWSKDNEYDRRVKIDYERFENTGKTPPYNNGAPQDYCPQSNIQVVINELYAKEEMTETDLFSGSDINLMRYGLEMDYRNGYYGNCPDIS